MPIDLLSPATALDLGGYDVPAYVALSSLVPAPIYAISATSSSDYYITQPSGGEAGDAAGFGALYLYVPTTLSAAIRVLGGKTDGSTQGWFPQISANANKASVRGTSAWSEPVGPSLLGSDLGRVHAFLMHMTGSFVRVYWNTTSRVTELAITGYTPGAVSEQLGKISSLPATGIHILGRLTFRGNPSLAQLQALLDAARTRGDLPTSLAGATLTHRQSVRDALAGLGAVDGQTAPASLPDTITGAAADAMTRTGSPVVRVIDTSIDGRATYGALGFGATAHLTTATPGGVRGSVSGFSFVHHAILWSLTGTEVLFHCANSSGTQGWYLVRESATLRWYSSNGVGGIASSPTRTLTSSDLGRPLIIYGVRDAAGMLYLYLDGASVAAATGPVASYALASWATMIGINQALANPAVSMSWFGSGGGSGAAFIFDAADVAAHYAASVALGQIATHAKLEHIWRPTTDIVAAGGASSGVPAQVQDRLGTDHLTRVGSGLQVAQRVDRIYSWEAA